MAKAEARRGELRHLRIFAILAITLATQGCAMSGGEWYQTCNEWAYTTAGEMETLNVNKRVAYRACQIEALKVYCDLNLAGDAHGVAGKLSDDMFGQVWKYCPNMNLFRMPFGGPPVFAIRQLEKEGGPSLVESYMPASWMLKHAFQVALEDCESEREKFGLFNEPQACLTDGLKYIDK